MYMTYASLFNHTWVYYFYICSSHHIYFMYYRSVLCFWELWSSLLFVFVLCLAIFSFFGFERRWWVFCSRGARLAWMQNLILVSIMSISNIIIKRVDWKWHSVNFIDTITNWLIFTMCLCLSWFTSTSPDLLNIVSNMTVCRE